MQTSKDIVVERLLERARCDSRYAPGTLIYWLADRLATEHAGRVEAEKERDAISTAFRVNMMRLSPDYSHEAFDRLIVSLRGLKQ